MNIDRIRNIVNSEVPDEVKQHLVLIELANDEGVIPDLMKMLDMERKQRKELVLDLNLHLSKAHIALTSPKLNKEGFVQDEIIQFFIKHKDSKGVGHCFMNMETLK